MTKILMIIGSLRKESFNRQLAVEITNFLQNQAETEFLYYSDIPFMNQDTEFPPPPQVQRIRSRFADSDGIWIVTPEYNSSYPGLLKNLLDWMSRPLKPNDFSSGTALAQKKIALSGAGGKAATGGCRQKLTELLHYVQADVMETPQTGVTISAESIKSGKLVLSEKDKIALQTQCTAFMDFIG